MITMAVPVYNMENFLSRCIERLIKQKGNYEILLIDDGSNDGSNKQCDEYAENYPHIIRVIHKKNGGLSSARNAGIQAAKGEFIIFPDPDDWVENNYIERLTELQNQFQPDMLCVGHYIDYDDKCIPANEGQSLVQMNGENAQRALLVPPCINGFAWNKLYHLDIIRNNNLKFRDDVGTTEDLEFTFRYLQYCEKVIFAPEEYLYHYYQREGAATHSGFSRKKLESIQTYERIIMSTQDLELIHAAKEEICNIAINLVWLYKNSQARDDYAWKKIRKYIYTNLQDYLVSKRYGIGRKIQALLAFLCPAAYVILKNQVTND